MKLLIPGLWFRAPRWALARFCGLFSKHSLFLLPCIESLFKSPIWCEGFFQNVFLAQKSKEISVTISGKHIAPKLNLRKAMWTEQFNDSWCLTKTVVVAEVFFVLYSRLVGDKV